MIEGYTVVTFAEGKPGVETRPSIGEAIKAATDLTPAQVFRMEDGKGVLVYGTQEMQHMVKRGTIRVRSTQLADTPESPRVYSAQDLHREAPTCISSQ